MKTRTGKIARLPHEIRETLNHRIEDGVPGKDLVAWLNTLPEVQKVLAQHFQARPLNKQNLSDWRHGGYADWAASRDGRRQIREGLEEARSLSRLRAAQDGVDVTSYLGTFLVVELAEAIDNLDRVKDPTQRWKLLRSISNELSRLRTDDSREKRAALRSLQASQVGQIKPNQGKSGSKLFFPPFPARRDPSGSPQSA